MVGSPEVWQFAQRFAVDAPKMYSHFSLRSSRSSHCLLCGCAVPSPSVGLGSGSRHMRVFLVHLLVLNKSFYKFEYRIYIVAIYIWSARQDYNGEAKKCSVYFLDAVDTNVSVCVKQYKKYTYNYLVFKFPIIN